MHPSPYVLDRRPREMRYDSHPMNRMWPMLVVCSLALAMAAGGCKRDKKPPPPAPSQSPSASTATAASSASSAASAGLVRTPRPVGALPKAETPTIRTADGVKLGASLWVGGDAKAPAVVLVHRLGGTRAEWEPLVARLFPVHQPMNVLAIDLRGHGESVRKDGEKGKLAWQGFKTDEFTRMAKDVESAVQYLRKRPGGPPASLVFVGSDIGGTALVRAVHDAKIVTAGVCLISPGASLRGVDLYEPFGAVLSLPNLIVSGNADNVSKEPAIALKTMSKSGQGIQLASGAHSAEFLGADKPELWDLVADWVDQRVVGASP